MKPIVLLNPIAQLGGAERVLLEVLRGIRIWHPEANVVVMTLEDGPLLERARELGTKTKVIPVPLQAAKLGENTGGLLGNLFSLAQAAPALLATARQLQNELARLQPRVVHSFGLKTHMLLRTVKLSSAMKLWHVQDFYSQRSLTRRLIRPAGDGVDKMLAISDAVAEDLETLTGRAPVMVRNGVDIEHFANQGPVANLDSLAGMNAPAGAAVRIGLVATYATWKGHEVFLKAIAELVRAKSLQGCRFSIVGGPIYNTAAQHTQEDLEAMARKLKIDHLVGFVPFQADTAPVYRALDIVVHASTRPEPFGLVVAEAMAAGKAVIVSAAGGAKNLYAEGVTGLGHPPGDIRGLASAIERLAFDKELRERLGQNAAKHARREFGVDRFHAEIAGLYASLGG